MVYQKKCQLRKKIGRHEKKSCFFCFGGIFKISGGNPLVKKDDFPKNQNFQGFFFSDRIKNIKKSELKKNDIPCRSEILCTFDFWHFQSDPSTETVPSRHVVYFFTQFSQKSKFSGIFFFRPNKKYKKIRVEKK